MLLILGCSFGMAVLQCYLCDYQLAGSVRCYLLSGGCAGCSIGSAFIGNCYPSHYWSFTPQTAGVYRSPVLLGGAVNTHDACVVGYCPITLAFSVRCLALMLLPCRSMVISFWPRLWRAVMALFVVFSLRRSFWCKVCSAASVRCGNAIYCSGSYDGCHTYALWSYTVSLYAAFWDFWLSGGVFYTDASAYARAFLVRCAIRNCNVFLTRFISTDFRWLEMFKATIQVCLQSQASQLFCCSLLPEIHTQVNSFLLVLSSHIGLICVYKLAIVNLAAGSCAVRRLCSRLCAVCSVGWTLLWCWY